MSINRQSKYEHDDLTYFVIVEDEMTNVQRRIGGIYKSLEDAHNAQRDICDGQNGIVDDVTGTLRCYNKNTWIISKKIGRQDDSHIHPDVHSQFENDGEILSCIGEEFGDRCCIVQQNDTEAYLS